MSSSDAAPATDHRTEDDDEAGQQTVPEPTDGEAEKKAKKMAHLQSQIDDLGARIAATKAEIEQVKGSLRSPDPGPTVKAHIKLLHTYNDIRDIGQGLLGMIAERRGVRIRDVMEEFGAGEGD